MHTKDRFLYLDVGDVLLRFRRGLYQLASRFGRNYDQVTAVWSKYDDAVCRGKMTPQELWEKLKSELKLPAQSKLDFLEFWVSNFQPIVETHGLAYDLDGVIRMGLLTNIFSGTFKMATERGHIPNVNWHAIVQSCEEGLVKPDPKLFKRAQDLTQTHPERIVFADDSQKNITEAKLHGWETVLFDPNQAGESVQEIREKLHV